MTGPEATRERIIQAALQLFAQDGYTRTTTRAIAGSAGVNEVTLFRHFGNKKNLLYACMETVNESGFARVFEEHLTGDYEADIRMMAGLQMNSTLESFGLLRFALCEAQVLPEMREALQEGSSSNLAVMVRYFQRQIDEGVVCSELTAPVLAHAFDSLFSSSVFIQKILDADNLEGSAREDTVEAMAAIFIRGTRTQELDS